MKRGGWRLALLLSVALVLLAGAVEACGTAQAPNNTWIKASWDGKRYYAEDLWPGDPIKCDNGVATIEEVTIEGKIQKGLYHLSNEDVCGWEMGLYTKHYYTQEQSDILVYHVRPFYYQRNQLEAMEGGEDCPEPGWFCTDAEPGDQIEFGGHTAVVKRLTERKVAISLDGQDITAKCERLAEYDDILQATVKLEEHTLLFSVNEGSDWWLVHINTTYTRYRYK